MTTSTGTSTAGDRTTTHAASHDSTACHEPTTHRVQAAVRRSCFIPGCGKPTLGFSRHCSTHRGVARKHGHPEQAAVCKRDYSPFVPLIEARLRAEPDNPAWGVLGRRWDALVRRCRELAEIADNGHAVNRYQLAAAREILKLHSEVDWREVMTTAAAMVVLMERRPSLFRSDDAFRFQLARMVRRLRPLEHNNVPRQTVLIGLWLAEAFGVLGLRIARLEEEKREHEILDASELASGLGSLR